ncbi:hypothetical protein N7462_006849 [Penicillium macrosclerotiorum]|uniref:uncharacterized protein n=1 Tax=Penicillium macrosclerotiorum TaxID=303699 RepID=UPI002546913D|nr:uncharacterized protein N7462_006849 [Penicillium macrosclerotiorum]KAJ5678605.1 hypothetical protein N7462_006849 [Penicillium macrosclerotiorum]
MGNSQSSPSKDETRRTNRLSKPLTRKLAALSTPQSSRPKDDVPELATGLIGWQNPWVGSNISADVRTSPSKKKDGSPTFIQPDPVSPEQGDTAYISSPVDWVPDAYSPRSNSLSASPSVRRASYYPGGFGEPSRSSMNPRQPRRSNSVQTPLQRHNSVIYENALDDPTSSNTHFLVGNQRFSLTRRRSLLTRPGVATRRTTSAIRRVPSPIGEPDHDSLDEVLHWPLPHRHRVSLPTTAAARPNSPTDSRYTQLGALKLGSLRVVNGSASPCPSERTPLGPSHITNAGLGLENVETARPTGTKLDIPTLPDLKKSDDTPGSPFSFEKSPTIGITTRSKSILVGEVEDEGIEMSVERSSSQREKDLMEVDPDRRTSRSLDKSDSGYSSAASVRSFQPSRTRQSFDSQTSGSCTTDGARTPWVTNDQPFTPLNETIQRHLSLQDAKPGNFSRPRPNSGRWYDPCGPASPPLPDLKARRSSLCAPRYTEYPEQSYLGTKSVIATTLPSRFEVRKEESASARGPLYADRISTDIVDMIHTSAMSRPGAQQLPSIDTSGQIYRSSSQRYMNDSSETLTNGSRSRSRPGSRVWSQKPGMDVPPLPTILSPDHQLAGEAQDEEFPLQEPHRGRPRSRSQDFRRKQAKTRPPPDVYITKSAYALQ